MKNFTFTLCSFLFFVISSKYLLPIGYTTLSQQYALGTNLESSVSSSTQEYTTANSAKNRHLLKHENIHNHLLDQVGSSVDHIVLSDKKYRLTRQRENQEKSQFFDSSNPSYTLAKAAVTSAGVFDGEILVRTLWSNEKRSAGTYDLSTVWDGKDDNGNYVADKKYTIKVVSNNVTYDWLRPIGNTSDSVNGASVYHAAQIITNMVQVGSEMYTAVGYNEISSVHNKFAIDAPNRLTTTLKGGGQVIRFLATDGTVVYSAGQRDQQNSFITGIVPNPSGTDALASFSSGTPYSMATGSTFIYSAFDITGNADYITGLGVQQSGNYLFASHKTLNEIRVFNKTTGTLVHTITGIISARELAIYNNTLWLISSTNTVAKYTIAGDGTISAATLTLSGLTDPLSVAISPDGSKVAVIDRGTHNKVYVYDTTTGALVQTIGRSESYSNPTVYNDKFYFGNTKRLADDDYGTAHAFVQFQSDGSLWIGDYGNARCQHFAVNGSYINNIQYLGYSYSTQVDINNPTRVFSDYLEFSIDYTDNSWKFVRNWTKNIVIVVTSNYTADRMRSVVTLSNGRTYCLYADGSPRREIVELDLNTGIRHTGIYTENANCDLNSDGSIWQIGNNTVGQPTFWKRKLLTSFDSNNNPIWGSYVTIETTPDVTVDDPLTGDGYLTRNQQSTNGVIATFNSDNGKHERGKGYHLGGVKNGQWLFRASPSTRNDYYGDYPNDGAYDIGNSVNFAGSFMQALDKNIFWGYKGEFWKGSQTNMYNHYLDNGLMVGQFGVSGDIASLQGEAPPQMAGNANSGTYVKVGSDIHFFHCDEGQHAAMHHWKISKLNSIQEQFYSINKKGIPSLPPLPYIDLMAGVPVSRTITSGTGRWTYSPISYNRGAYDLWKVQAGVSTYKRDERSLRFTSYPTVNGLTQEGYCDLSVTTATANNYSIWQVTGRLTYPEISESYDNFIDIIDNLGKIIVRISRPESYPNAAVQVNGMTIVSGDYGKVMVKLFQNAQNLGIRRNGSRLLVSYANYPEISVAAFDPKANLNSPTTLRVHFYSADTRGHQIDLANLKFYPSSIIDGTGTGLAGKYFNNKDLNEPSVAVRTDSVVNFNWGLASPLPGQVNADNFSTRWSGQLQAPVSGTYIFSTSGDDGMRLWISGKLVINNWTYHATIDNTAPITLTAGQKYNIKLEYYDRGQAASIQLMWAHPGQMRQIIPKQWLYPTLDQSPDGRIGSDSEENIQGSVTADISDHIKAYPVPTHDFLWVKYYAKDRGDVCIQLVNVNAQPVLQLVYLATRGENTFRIPVKEFIRGVYLLNLIQGYRRASQRVILSD